MSSEKFEEQKEPQLDDDFIKKIVKDGKSKNQDGFKKSGKIGNLTQQGKEMFLQFMSEN